MAASFIWGYGHCGSQILPQALKDRMAHLALGGFGAVFDLGQQGRRCETEASIPLEHVRRPRDTPIWKLEAALKCRSCRTPRYSPRVHMIKLTMQREIASYKWVHPDDDERR